jgi:tetratricopeptide (TPR) repeat protein
MTMRAAILLSLAWISLAAAPAAAQPAQPAPPAPKLSDAQRKAEAKHLADEATRKYNLGQFQEALDGYSKAYETFPAASLLFNLGQCHRSLGNHERAVFFYEGYLREKPNAPNRDVVEELLTEERGLLTKQRDEEAAKKAADDEARKKQAEEEAKRKADEEAERKRAADDERRRRASLIGLSAGGEGAGGSHAQPIYKRWWFWTALGVGAGILAGSTIYIVQRDTVLPAGSLGTLDGRGDR